MYDIITSETTDNATSFLAVKNEMPMARLSCLLVDDIERVDTPCGIIGNYEAAEKEAGIALLKEAKKHFAGSNAKVVIGPMNGSSWGSYRLLMPKAPDDPIFDPPHFLGEPQNPPDYPSHYFESGFSIADQYESRIVHDLSRREEKGKALARKMERLQITLSPMDMEHYEKQLNELFIFSTKTFAKNPYYRAIDFTEFKTLYEGIKPYLDADFVLLARDKNQKLVGFIFAYPDMLSLQSGKPQRLVFKTLAASENMRASGLGLFLVDTLHSKAHQKGYKSVIHALMHSDNNSLKLSLKGIPSELFNRYALFQWVP